MAATRYTLYPSGILEVGFGAVSGHSRTLSYEKRTLEYLLLNYNHGPGKVARLWVSTGCTSF